MRLLKQALAFLGALVVVAVMVVLVAPKNARAVENLMVQITNTVANPVPMLDVDNPAHQPASLEILLQAAASTSITAPSSLPSGGAYRELVVNWVTGTCFVDTTSGASPLFTISLATDGSQLSFFSATGSTPLSSGIIVTYFGTKTGLYASPGSTISLVALNGTTIQLITNSNGESVKSGGAEGTCLINANGYYVTQ